MRDTRRRLVLVVALAAAGVAVGLHAGQRRQPSLSPPIDRHALVSRHNPVLHAGDRSSPLTLGNGEFAFTADVTGLQTFPDTPPLLTQSQWGWHTFPNPQGYKPSDAYAPYDTYGRSVDYASGERTDAGAWLRENPQRLNLAQIGFVLTKADGAPAAFEDLQEQAQTLDLWTGTLTSRFTFEHVPVRVDSWVHPDRDLLAVRIDRGALLSQRLAIRIAFPYANPIHSGDPSDWMQKDRHTTAIVAQDAHQIEWRRTLDADAYSVKLAWLGAGQVQALGPHEFLLLFDSQAAPREFSVAFSKAPLPARLPDVGDTRTASASHWQAFWERGGAIDLSGSADPRASELERRIVLSQYLTAIQCAGSLPPQETGLSYNSWFGKFHLEMHWWHAAHFALWSRAALLERSLPWYRQILPAAHSAATRQGYTGARWPKMTATDGRDSPSGIGPFLIWQQPHPIYLAELIYRQRSNQATLEQYRSLVFESAEFMASYAVWKKDEQRYVLGPPLIPAQEIHPPRTTFNPGFELAYWRFGLETAQRWRERLGLPREPRWDRVLQNLSALPSRDGLYVNAESAPDTFTNAEQRRDHPTLLAPCGMLPCEQVDREMMRRTLREVMRSWNFEQTWGWDYPLIAMTAARLGEPEAAVDALLMKTQKNTYLPNGHNYQDSRLTIYLPGNGGLLTAAAMMAAGWDGAPDVATPGFPQDGRWKVRWEGLAKLP